MKFVNSLPVAKFFYKGHHSHPVRRTILIVEQSDKIITGYELREGSTVREFKKAPIKSFRRSQIAKINQIDARRVLRKTTNKNNWKNTTLTRKSLTDLIQNGA